MMIVLNGSPYQLDTASLIVQLVRDMGLEGQRIAVELNGEIIHRGDYPKTILQEGDKVEIVRAIGGGQDDSWMLAGRSFHSRLLVGTGKYRDLAQTRDAVIASGAEIITVAIRRINIGQTPGEPSLLDVLPPDRFTLLPNTAGCYTAEDAIRTCRLARELLDGHSLVKLEVLGDPKTLFPDVSATLEASHVLVKEGFQVMVYTNDDPIMAKRLEDAGCIAVMPLAAPIGSGLGIRNPYNIMTILEQSSVPVLVDAGVGTASDAAIAMELGCHGVLMNTAIAEAQQPVLMASAMRKAIEAGREAFLAGRMPRRRFASASSPLEGLSDSSVPKPGQH